MRAPLGVWPPSNFEVTVRIRGSRPARSRGIRTTSTRTSRRSTSASCWSTRSRPADRPDPPEPRRPGRGRSSPAGGRTCSNGRRSSGRKRRRWAESIRRRCARSSARRARGSATAIPEDRFCCRKVATGPSPASRQRCPTRVHWRALLCERSQQRGPKLHPRARAEHHDTMNPLISA